MANEQITFDKLPQAVGYLTEQMEQIRQMGLSHRTDGTNPTNGGGTTATNFFRQASSC